jgi:K(+)-stimulated pyrophosphate-energized sodium pump
VGFGIMTIELIPIGAGILALLVAAFLALWVNKQHKGTPKMQEIYSAIREGSYAYMKRQYKTIAIISLVLAVVLYAAFDFGRMPLTSAAFLLGAFASLVAGWLSMEVATRANVRTAAAGSVHKALRIAFSGGMVMGLANVALSLIGVTSLYILYGDPRLIIGFGFGASLSALFAQLGGGIYTKAADVGADLVGKIEKGIPEDDPRNAAVIADNVGDNVGDVAGRGADLFESLTGENIGAMIIGLALYAVTQNIFFVLFPLLARSVGVVATILGLPFVRGKEGVDPIIPLRNGVIATVIFATIGFYFLTINTLGSLDLFWAGLSGIIASLLIVLISEYYTGMHKPVKAIAKASETGPATNIITGLAYGLESAFMPVIVISAAIGVSFYFGGLFGVAVLNDFVLGGIFGTAVATMGMLSIAGMILGLDGFGPIVDNAAGIVQMSGGNKALRKRMDAFDSAGNTTKALTKGYALGSAGLAALLLFRAYLDEVHISVVDIARPEVLIASFIGAVLPFIFASLAIKAVGGAAHTVVEEVRRQFRQIKGIMSGKAKPDYARCVDISTAAAQRGMVLPGMLVITSPVLVGFILGPMAAGGFLMSATISGFVLAMWMNTGGGAWDNAKKYIERFEKHTPKHAAAVVGDTVGDPLKDTAGPSIHVLIKLLGTLSITLGLLFAQYALIH